ncbi:SHUGOSHIN 2-like isoform X2 [Rhododendron vialii]|uniref:SHUGOSHIN 2-like isoform X2 n=1 Tax=Rhododendron vialii TaxID=182163 RepID=UPI00265EF081|nr:SHUGOSHIN 2-like isoform X2 [Rhododendron vialii]
MSATEGFFVLGSESSLAGEKPKVAKTAKSSFGSAARKKLGDISNLPQRPQSLVQHEKEKFVPNFTKEYIEQLQKENAALVKLLADRNKIIELSGFELQKLRINLQKMQQQNMHLAQANNQMLVELNSGKDRLKALQHELGCRNGLLKARELELEETAKMTACQEMDNQVHKKDIFWAGTSKSEEDRESSEPDRDDNKQCNKNKKQQSKSLSLATVKQNQLKEKTGNKSVSLRRQSARFKSEEPEPTEDKFEVRASTSEEARESLEPDRDDKKQKSKCLIPSTLRPVQLGEKTGNKRVSLRRQSARFKSEEPEDAEDKFEADDAKLPECSLYDDQIPEDGPASMRSSALKDDGGCRSGPNGDDAKELRRPSIGRPSRLAATKVQSYKEIPLKVKMRRPE